MSSAGKKGKKDTDGKEKKVVISLWINKTKYSYGKLCTFCNKLTAILHCPDCTDFFCFDCDVAAHSVKKRADHVRSTMSKLNLAQASGLVTRYVRLVQHLKLLQKKIRKIYRRYFDKNTLCHYYYNPVYGTVSWKKPYCLRKEELFPHHNEYSGATKIQLMYHLWKARIKINANLRLYYRKIFDRSRGRFYYAWHGPSQLLPRASWRAPKLFGKRGYPRDIAPIYTKDVASIIIQRQWRAIMVRRLFYALVRTSYDQLWDPVSGSFTYLHRETDVLYRKKPLLLGNQPWDPNFIPDWTKHDVSIFMRRIGLKQYANTLFEYGINGRTLVQLDQEDFDNLNIFNKVHIRKIQVEVAKRFTVVKRERISEEHAFRREKIRKIKIFTAASLAIQVSFRMYLARKELKMRKELKRLRLFEAEVKAEVARMGVWWANREDIPSKTLTESSVPEVPAIKQKQNEKGVEKGANAMSQVLKNSSGQLKLPFIPLKLFGRKRDHLTAKGWGKFQSHGVLTKVDLTPYLDHQGKGAENFTGTDNITRAFSLKLNRKGYDSRRGTRFMGIELGAYVDPDLATVEDAQVEDDESTDPGDNFADEDAARAQREKEKTYIKE